MLSAGYQWIISGLISGLSVGYQRVIRGLSEGYQWVIRGLSVGYQCVISRLSEGYQRVISGLSAGYLVNMDFGRLSYYTLPRHASEFNHTKHGIYFKGIVQ